MSDTPAEVAFVAQGPNQSLSLPVPDGEGGHKHLPGGAVAENAGDRVVVMATDEQIADVLQHQSNGAPLWKLARGQATKTAAAEAPAEAAAPPTIKRPEAK